MNANNDKQTVKTRLHEVEARIDAACARAQRSADSVRLLPVSKTVAPEKICTAYAAGYRSFGENKVQEAKEKHHALHALDDIDWVIIGHLQTNKAKWVARYASEFQALDSLRVAEALERRLQREGRCLDVLIQVNTSGEASKFGLAPAEVPAFIHALQSYNALRVQGLMTLALFSADSARVRPCFIALRELRDRLLENLPESMSMRELSMGMSGDFEIAIEEGATTVRIGQAIFGTRPLHDSHYWPS